MQNQTKSVILIALVWLSVLVVWAVSSIDKHLQQSNANMYGGVGVTGSPPGGFVVDQYVTAVPMGKNEVWIIDQNRGSVQVITRDLQGDFHWTYPEYPKK